MRISDWSSDVCSSDLKTSPTLFGFDFSFAPPLVERRAYFPGDNVPANARAFWASVDQLCQDEDWGAASLLAQHHRRHFYLGKADGVNADYMDLRRCEGPYNAGGGGQPSHVSDPIRAGQG